MKYRDEIEELKRKGEEMRGVVESKEKIIGD